MQRYSIKKKLGFLLRPVSNIILVSICFIMIITFLAFLPCLNNGFVVTWDDNRYITQNEIIKDLSFLNIKKIFTSFHSNLYKPLVILSFALEYHFFGLTLFVYHFTNVLLHVLNCLLVFWLVFLISRKAGVSFLTTILFAIHPMHVESVAWISERKDLLYGFFFLMAFIFYIYYRKTVFRRYYYLVFFVFILSLLAKPAAIFLPILLLFYDYSIGRKINKESIVEKIPLFIISLIFVILNLLNSTSYLRKDTSLSLLDNFSIVNYTVVFYLSKLIMPLRLSCLYPYPLKNGSFLPPIFLLSPIIVLIILFIIVFFLKYNRKVIFGAAFFLVTIFPALQIIPVTTMIVNDHYAYISSIGIFLLIAEFISWIYYRKMKHNKLAVYFLAIGLIGIIAVLSFLTWNRCKVWKSDLTLWNNAINSYPYGYIPWAYYNRGLAYYLRQEHKNAIADFNTALMLCYRREGNMHKYYKEIYNKLSNQEDGYSEKYSFLALEFYKKNMVNEAMVLFKKSIEINPRNIQAYIGLAAGLNNLYEYKSSIAVGNKILELEPNSADAQYNLSVAYYFDKQYDLAIKHYEIADKLGYKVSPEFLKKIEEYMIR